MTKAGFFEADVTPPVGSYLAGFPSRHEGSQGVEDPLYLRIVALDDDAGERVVLVTADLLKWPRDMSWRTKMWAEEATSSSSPQIPLKTPSKPHTSALTPTQVVVPLDLGLGSHQVKRTVGRPS